MEALTVILFSSLPLWKKETMASSPGIRKAVNFISVTMGRVIGGFITMKISDIRMIRMGRILIAAGVPALLPSFLALVLAFMTVMHESLARKAPIESSGRGE